MENDGPYQHDYLIEQLQFTVPWRTVRHDPDILFNGRHLRTFVHVNPIPQSSGQYNIHAEMDAWTSDPSVLPKPEFDDDELCVFTLMPLNTIDCLMQCDHCHKFFSAHELMCWLRRVPTCPHCVRVWDSENRTLLTNQMPHEPNS